MKVVKKGRPQKGWAKEYPCTGKGNGGGGCGAVLLVEAGDLFHTVRCVHVDTDYFVTFRCSECQVLTDIKEYPGRATDLPHYNDWRKNQGDV